MGRIELYDHQRDVLPKMKNGCILCGGVGSGKSRTGLAYYYISNKGVIDGEDSLPMVKPCDLYIITTAKKRDTLEWENELSYFLLSTHPEISIYKNKVVINSWNNIKKYEKVENSFFIFDEQRVVGYGAWTKSFLKITSKNQWILLTATPGDSWMDYIPVFIANGFYKHKTDFVNNHVNYKWEPHGKFYKVDSYRNTGRLVRLRNSILVDMKYERNTISHHEDVYTIYDTKAYRDISRNRWNPWDNRPIENATEYCLALRRVVNSSEARQVALLELFEKHQKAIVFYNFDYELDILRGLYYGEDVEVAEWNGHKHQPIPDGDKWIYLVQYTAGAEGWNCIKTNTIIFYSQNYSYKTMVQASGRIDRLNTPYVDLYYYHLKSRSGIDVAISKALSQKKDFNNQRFYSGKDQ